MMRSINPNTLAHLWQRQAEVDLESGRRPLLGLGLGNVDAESLVGLLAVQRFGQRAAALAEPQVVTGGDGDLWLSALLLRPPADDETPPAFSVSYGGNDVATHAAALTIAAPPPSAGAPTLPAGMAWALTPTALPGSERADLEFLPFVQDSATFAPVSPSTSASSHWIDQVEAWAVLLLVLALLLTAIFV